MSEASYTSYHSEEAGLWASTNPAFLMAARNGDAEAFSRITEPYRRELQVHCYRILGSTHEAEDMVQESFLRAWRRLDTYEGRASFRAWLYKITTNACLDALDKQRTRRRLPPHLGPASDPYGPIMPATAEKVWLEPVAEDWLVDAAIGPEAQYNLHESVTLAFLTALQTLLPRQRAVLILSDVLDWSAREIADLLEMSVPAVNSALHRARLSLAKQYSPGEPDPIQDSPSDEEMQALLQRYVRAWERADVTGLVALLKEDASLSMPPSPSWYGGVDAVRAFVADTVFADNGMFPGLAEGRWRMLATRANGQSAFGQYIRAEDGKFQPFGLHILTFVGPRITEMVTYIDASLPGRFGLPAVIEAPTSEE